MVETHQIFFTGTHIYRVFKIIKHIPCFNFLFGRQIKCIYTGQPQQTNFQSNSNTQQEHTERHPVTNTETHSDTNIETHSDTNLTKSDIETNKTENNNSNNNITIAKTNHEIDNQTKKKEKTHSDIKQTIRRTKRQNTKQHRKTSKPIPPQ